MFYQYILHRNKNLFQIQYVYLYLLYSTELCSMKGENWKKIENNEYKFHT